MNKTLKNWLDEFGVLTTNAVADSPAFKRMVEPLGDSFMGYFFSDEPTMLMAITTDGLLGWHEVEGHALTSCVWHRPNGEVASSDQEAETTLDLHLLHGRKNQHSTVSGRGFDGPVISGLQHVYCVYGHHIRFSTDDSAGDRGLEHKFNCGFGPSIEYKDDLLHVPGVGFFGDWVVTPGGKKVRTGGSAGDLAMVQTSVAIAMELTNRDGNYDRIYRLFRDVSGFIGVEIFLAGIGMQAERSLALEWGHEARHYIEDVSAIVAHLLTFADAEEEGAAPTPASAWKYIEERLREPEPHQDGRI